MNEKARPPNCGPQPNGSWTTGKLNGAGPSASFEHRLEHRGMVLKETIAAAVLTVPLFVAIAGARAGAGPDTYVPACVEFRGRLETADRMLNLRQITPIRLIQKSQESNGDDLWTMHDADGEKIMDLTCRGGKFVRLAIIFPHPKASANANSLPPQFDYIAAGIFGFTGWSTGKVIQTATDVWNTKLRLTPGKEKKENFENVNSPGLCATISYSEFTVGDCAD
jgi:hypothetical protein